MVDSPSIAVKFGPSVTYVYYDVRLYRLDRLWSLLHKHHSRSTSAYGALAAGGGMPARCMATSSDMAFLTAARVVGGSFQRGSPTAAWSSLVMVRVGLGLGLGLG